MNADGTRLKIWESVILYKFKFSDRFIFDSEELDHIFCGTFSPADVEIVNVFGREIKLTLIRGEYKFLINLLFLEESDILKFFEAIRSQQKNVIISVFSP